MAFKKGDPKPAGSGRQKGSANKVNPTAAQIMAQYGVSGIEGLCKIAAGLPLRCTTHLNKESGEVVVEEIEPTFEQRQAAFKELAQYEAPKLKAIEHSGKDGDDIPLGIALRIIKTEE